ncbi:MAG: HD domain-containing phosphohydrolase [Terracidiphilus sp.]|jgi:PAS domain S-box-containing protein
MQLPRTDELTKGCELIQILHLEDNFADRELVKALLDADGVNCQITAVETKEEFVLKLLAGPWDLILSDHSLPAFDGLQALKIANETCPGTPFIFVTGTLGEEAAILSLKSGATDYILKQRMARLGASVRRALAERAEKRKLEEAKAKLIKSEEQLRESEEQLRATFEQAEVGMAQASFEGHILRCNPRFAQILGYSPEELTGVSFQQITVPEDSAESLSTTERIRRGEIGSGSLEKRHFRKDGTITWGKITLSRQFDVEGRSVCFIAILEDINDRKIAEQRLIESQEELLRAEIARNQFQESLRVSLEETVQLVAGTIEQRDPYTAGHQRRVADLCVQIAEAMGLSADRAHGLQLAATIHDLGKIAVPTELLTKPGLLSKPEFSLIKEHAELGYEIIKKVHFPWPIADMVRQHHERLDGSGYPQGLLAATILPESKILAVADVVEAMSSPRPYRPSRGIEAALDEIIAWRGTKFDPQAVDACVSLFRNRGYQIPA